MYDTKIEKDVGKARTQYLPIVCYILMFITNLFYRSDVNSAH